MQYYDLLQTLAAMPASNRSESGPQELVGNEKAAWNRMDMGDGAGEPVSKDKFKTEQFSAKQIYQSNIILAWINYQISIMLDTLRFKATNENVPINGVYIMFCSLVAYVVFIKFLLSILDVYMWSTKSNFDSATSEEMSDMWSDMERKHDSAKGLRHIIMLRICLVLLVSVFIATPVALIVLQFVADNDLLELAIESKLIKKTLPRCSVFVLQEQLTVSSMGIGWADFVLVLRLLF